MAVKLKPLNEQVMVITGASSGIGLATAEKAATQGVRLVLAARSESALNDIVARINGGSGTALAVGCDVADRTSVERVARQTI